MIEVIKNESGFALVCEYCLADKHGNNVPDGTYLYIADFKVHPKHKGPKIIKTLIRQFLAKYPNIRYCYFDRGKYHKTYFHTRREYERLIKEDKNEVTE